MATRTIKLMGKAYSTSGDVSVVVNFNRTDVDAYFGEVNENSSATDGKTNITFSSVDGDAQTRTLANADDYGDWTYRIDDGITFGCDFALDSSLVILTVPTP
jgi:hypothetical protein